MGSRSGKILVNNIKNIIYANFAAANGYTFEYCCRFYVALLSTQLSRMHTNCLGCRVLTSSRLLAQRRLSTRPKCRPRRLTQSALPPTCGRLYSPSRLTASSWLMALMAPLVAGNAGGAGCPAPMGTGCSGSSPLRIPRFNALALQPSRFKHISCYKNSTGQAAMTLPCTYTSVLLSDVTRLYASCVEERPHPANEPDVATACLHS